MRLLFVIVVMLCEVVMAQGLRERQGEYRLVDHLRGEIRFGYIDTGMSALGAAGHMHMRTDPLHGLALGATLEGVVHLDGYNPEFFPKDGSFATLSELYLSYLHPRLSLMAGRMMVESTPHIDSDDVRLFPNYFRGIGVQMECRYGDVRLMWLDRMAGWGSGDPIDRWKRFDEVLGVSTDVAGVAALGISSDAYEAWFYHIDRIGEIFYLAGTVEQQGWSVGVQADIATDHWSQSGMLQSRTLGFFGEWLWQNLSFLGALNKEFGAAAAPSFGGGPLYTSMEILSLDLFGEDAMAWSIGVESEINTHTVGVMMGRFWGKEGSDKELDLYISKRTGSGLGYDMVYGWLKNGENLFRVIIRYGF